MSDSASAHSGASPSATRSAIVELLPSLPLFEGLTLPQLERLAPLCELQEFAAGKFLFREGEATGLLHLIRFGQVSLQLQVPGRGGVQLQTLRPGELLGLSWVQPNSHWLFDAKASTLTRTLAIRSAELVELMESDPTLGYPLMKRIALTMGVRLQATRLQLLDLYHEPGR